MKIPKSSDEILNFEVGAELAVPITYGYARVSTNKQDLDVQYDALLRAGVLEENIRKEKISGFSLDRPVLVGLLNRLHRGDTLIVYKFDRLGRNCRDILNLINKLQTNGIKLIDLSLNVKYEEPVGKLIIQIFASIAELERNMIRERTKAKIDYLKSMGVKLGRKVGSTKVSPTNVANAYNAMKPKNASQLARDFKLSVKTVYNYLHRVGVKTLMEEYHDRVKGTNE